MGMLKPLRKLRQRGTSNPLRDRLMNFTYESAVCVRPDDFTRLDIVDGMRWLGFWFH
jgi:hypothetical protein